MIPANFYAIFSLIIFVCGDLSFNFKEKFTDGENNYKHLISQSLKYGNCWTKALSDIQSACKFLTEETQSRLALSFTNCFLEHSGVRTCPCLAETPIKHCLNNSSDRIFSTYTEFFTHTQSICYFLQHQAWQKETEQTVLRLVENSESVGKKLDQSSKSQSKILKMQHTSLIDQQRMIANGRYLNSELQKSRIQAKETYKEFKFTTEEQQRQVFEVFDRIKSIQHLVMGEFMSIYTFAFYVIGIAVIYVSTSLPRTSDARFWLLLLISVNAAIERYLSVYCLDEELLQFFPFDFSSLAYSRIWLCRKVTSCLGFTILLYFYYCYKDYSSLNFKLLCDIKQQNIEFREFIKGIKLTQASPTCTSFIPIEVKAKSTNEFVDHAYQHANSLIGTKSINISPIIKRDRCLHSTPEMTEKSMKPKKRKPQSDSVKKVLLPSKENIERVTSAQKRYNLRTQRTTLNPSISLYM